MERMIERCAGLDVHQATVVACVLINQRGRRPRKELRTFGRMTHELEALREWPAAECVTHLGMESTGVYWRPVHAVLGYVVSISPQNLGPDTSTPVPAAA